MAIFNFGPWETKGLPVLDSALPADVAVEATKSATFEVKITKDGNPKEYTYQWYYDGKAVSGATSASYTRTTTKSDGGNHLVYCTVTNKAGTITSRTANLSVDDSAYRSPQFTYSGNYQLVDDSGKAIQQGSDNSNWNIRLLTSGRLNFSSVGNAKNGASVFLVGGGAGGRGAADYSPDGGQDGGEGGSGAYSGTYNNVSITENKAYDITIGAGGSGGEYYASTGYDGGKTTAFGYTANGGTGLSVDRGTFAFGGNSGNKYGAAGTYRNYGRDGTDNSGNGGDGAYPVHGGATGGRGGSGIVIIRNKR